MRNWCILLVLLAALGAWAQPDPNQPPTNGAQRAFPMAPPAPFGGGAVFGGQAQPGQNPPQFMNLPMEAQGAMFMPQFLPFGNAPETTLMEVTPNGFFVLRDATLLKYDPATMKQQGTLELFGPLPKQPNPAPQGGGMAPAPEGIAAPFALPMQPDAVAPNVGNAAPFVAMPADAAGWTQWMQEKNRRAAPEVMLVKDPAILIVVGNAFFRVNQQTLAIEAKGNLVANENAAGMLRQPMTAKLHGDLLYLVEGTTVCVVDTANGQVKGRANLPASTPPIPPGMQGPMVQIGAPPQPPLMQPAGPAPFQGVGEPADEVPANASNPIVGTISKHEHTWVITTDDAQVYILEGAKSRVLAATPGIASKRVRLVGMLDRNPGDNAFAQGYMDVLAYQMLTDPPAL